MKSILVLIVTILSSIFGFSFVKKIKENIKLKLKNKALNYEKNLNNLSKETDENIKKDLKTLDTKEVYDEIHKIDNTKNKIYEIKF